MDIDFNFYVLFVIDLMHEFELGVFKALFIHLIRICYAIGPHVVQILNERFAYSSFITALFLNLTYLDSAVFQSLDDTPFVDSLRMPLL